MAGVSLDELPAVARTAWARLRDDLRSILGDDLVAMWAHGGTTAIEDGQHAGDLDTHAIVARAPNEETARRIREAQDAIAGDLGVEWDAWYVLAADARRAEPPHHAFRAGRRDTSWALHRAHWTAGRYVALHGPEPVELVIPPTWEELEGELNRELEHLERHVVEGDTDPSEAAYAFLNGSRVLHAVETRNVVISKLAAGRWALEHLPSRWHPALQAALHSYQGKASAGDDELLAAEMAPFVAYVRERLPAIGGRPVDAIPRWSGY